MVKQVLTAFFLCLILAVICILINTQLLVTPLRFSINAIYGFHAIASFIVYVLVFFIYQKMPNQAGYIYLTSVFVKMGVFVLMFKNTVFSIDELTKPERITLLVPLILFLTLEAVLVSKILSQDNK
ncbi:hypothetical protein CLV86_1797 [Lacinutrix venerupis]|uniref:DUF6168 family protein n=1 Tax=Lacinutrix venerupis TaxID=1486034 RepID=UPI000EAE4D5F|nr:DUF6168 family protein [Lacinutrix venerupis]RLJ63260.1 hypothetical protein CLV86_1797 [Lacinutrix venerupis]